MKFIQHSIVTCRLWTKFSLRKALILTSLLIFTCGALFGIGQLQAYQSMPPVHAFYHEGGRTGILLIHGFGGSPVEVQPLADGLSQMGYTVDVPLLPGHGKTPRDFGATTNENYLQFVRRQLDTLRNDCDHVYVVGFSMGGLLAVQLEQETQIDGLVLMSTPIQPWNDKAEFNWLKTAAEVGTKLHLFVPTLGIPDLVKSARRKVGDLPQNLIEPNYAAYPATSCLRILQLIEDVKPELASVTVPTLIIQSQNDRVSAPSSGKYLYQHLGSDQKRLVYLPQGGHVIALSRERDEVVKLVEDFVATGSLR
jgi:carboxylesterase